MSWKDILKETIAQNRVKEIEDIDIDIEDDDCNRKLQQMANKLKNYNLLLKQRWEAGWPQYQEYFEVVEDKQDDKFSNFNIQVKEEHKYSAESYLFESVTSIYNPIPEEVACKALELLETAPRTQLEYDSAQTITFKGYIIYRDFNYNYEYNVNKLVVRRSKELDGLYDDTPPNGKDEIRLSWSNGEDTGIVQPYGYSESIILSSGSDNIYKTSGYYDAREFGFSWHE